MRNVWINPNRERLVLKLKCKKTLYNKMENTIARLCVWDKLITIALIKIQPKLQINNWTFTLEFWKYLATYLFESLREMKNVIFKEVFYKPKIKKDQLSHKYQINGNNEGHRYQKLSHQ